MMMMIVMMIKMIMMTGTWWCSSSWPRWPRHLWRKVLREPCWANSMMRRMGPEHADTNLHRIKTPIILDHLV